MTTRTALHLGLVAGCLSGLVVYGMRGPSVEIAVTHPAPPAAPSPPTPAATPPPLTPTALPDVEHGFGANYAGRTLVNVSFVGRALRNANFTGAILRGVDFRDAQLNGARFDRCLCDPYCRWPAGFDPARHGVIQLLLQTR